jgi:arylsulfatase
MKPTFLSFLGVPVIGVFLLGCAAGASPRPNVLIILTDDQGHGDFSGHGNPVLKTPNLDRLRDQAVRFADFHNAPMCTSARGQPSLFHRWPSV